jgi:Mg-chelatase subunit ChlI
MGGLPNPKGNEGPLKMASEVKRYSFHRGQKKVTINGERKGIYYTARAFKNVNGVTVVKWVCLASPDDPDGSKEVARLKRARKARMANAPKSALKKSALKKITPKKKSTPKKKAAKKTAKKKTTKKTAKKTAKRSTPKKTAKRSTPKKATKKTARRGSKGSKGSKRPLKRKALVAA